MRSPDQDELEYLRAWQRWARLVMSCTPGGDMPARVRAGIADADDLAFLAANPEPKPARRGPRRKDPIAIVAELVRRQGGR